MRRITPLLLLILLSLCTGSPNRALAEETRAPMTLEDLLRLAYENNGAIAAARAGAEAAGARVGHAGALPGPQLRATAFIVPIETRVGPQWFSLSLAQRFPWFGKLHTRTRIASHAAAVAAIHADARIRDVLVDVKIAWFELHYLTRALEIVRENREIARHIVDFGTSAYARDEVPFYDVHRARAEMARLSYDEAKLLDLATVQEARLLALVGEDAGGGIDPPTPLPFLEMRLPLDELTELALAHRLELDAASTSVEGAEAGVRLARKDYWPDFVVGVSWMAHEEKGPAPDAGKDAFGLTVGLDLPVWAWQVDDRIDEATARVREARETLRDGQNRTRAEVVERYVALMDAARLLRLYRGNLLPQARAALESAEVESREGRSLAALLERKALWLRFRLAEQRALADYYKAVARLEQIVSVPLPLTSQNEETPSGRLSERTAATNDPAVNDVLEALRARMEAWTNGLPGPGSSGLVDRASKADQDAQPRVQADELLNSLKGRVSEALVDLAVLHRNRGVRAADRALKAAIRRYPQTAHLDNLVAQYQDLATGQRSAAGMGLAPMTRESRSGDGTLTLQGDITTVEVEIAAVNAGLARRQAITEGRRALARYAWAREASSAVRDLEEIIGQLVEIVRIRLAVGTAGQSELLRLEVLRKDLETRRRNLNDEAAQAQATLAGVLDLPSGAALGPPRGARVPGDIPGLDALVRGALSRRHELRRIRLELRKLDLVIDLQKTRAQPGLATGMSDLRDPLAAEGTLAFPDRPMAPTDIFLGGREAWLDELRERRQGMDQRRRDLESQLRAEVEGNVHALRQHRRTWRAHSGEMLEKSHQRLELERSGYQQGRRSFQDVMEAEEEYIRHRLEGIDALRNARLAWADLRAAAVLIDSTGGPSITPDHPGG